jgi:hypothetical protein
MQKFLLAAIIMMWGVIPAWAQTNTVPKSPEAPPVTADSAASDRKAEEIMSTTAKPAQTEVDRKAAASMTVPTK